MKKILIILTFLFVSIFIYSESAFSYSKSVNIDFDIRVMMGLTKIEEKDNPKYKKFLNYIDENLAKKGEVKYSHKVNMDKKVVEFFSEKGEFLLAENLPKEFLDIVDRSIRVAENKEEIKKTIKNIYEDPYTYVSISKYKENLILFTEQNMVNRGKIKNTMSVVLKRELTDNEKNELIYLKNNDNDEFFKKYRTYLESETTKTYINDKLELFQEIKVLTEITILYKNEISKVVIEYSDNSRINSVVKSYRNDRLLNETFFKNKDIVLEKEYYASGKLAREIPLKDGLINGEAKDYYENGKIRSTTNFVNGDIDGVVKEYNQAGKVIKETLYKNGKKVN
ncbi:toxin-antitoxin system YwqK family antitoxin [Fusobacterium canifelinum]|uniref:Toxin-antitoxin system YwqK family antitoxin n=1 Tax=Fusobacterium canifelinum TaxID=285729 RepID=A0ABX7CCD6_9FUSO|nr:toxin-antitoxin system YwqK family antitoxin [Fusobacterium canifelinum]QQS87205.1 toxin-antitoxin system YwqK family antitoxin [Fusobacterium canifelinum]